MPGKQALHRRYVFQQIRPRQYQCGYDAGDHAPEVAVAVEAPPVPLEDVGGGVAAPQAGDDPQHDGVDRGDVPADETPITTTAKELM
jgi:hypothetical protein